MSDVFEVMKQKFINEKRKGVKMVDIDTAIKLCNVITDLTQELGKALESAKKEENK